MEYLMLVVKIAKVAIGLGFVIFIHELGHFLMAKWNGVKVEKFSIGFGPTLLGWTRGETEYVLAALPLGGFVKMLGEGPEDEESKTTDPRAYPNKSVGARMAIISAGVIMNVFLGLACFSFFYTQPREEVPAVIGAVGAGSPAYAAGLEPGDEIVAIDGRKEPSFSRLLQKVVLSGTGDVLHLEVKRPGQSQVMAMDIEPRRETDMDRPTIGVSGGRGLMVFDFQPPAGMESPPTYPKISDSERKSKIDYLVAAAPQGKDPKSLPSYEEYARMVAANPDAPITHVIERRRIGEPPDSGEKFEVVIPPCRFVDFGLRFTIQPVTCVKRDSPADRAGFRLGDRILKVDGRDDFDPMRLPQDCFRSAGKPMTFEVERAGPGGEPKTFTLTAAPTAAPPKTGPVFPNEPIDAPGLGLCYSVRTRVVAVAANSPAAKAGIKPGDLITGITIPASTAGPREDRTKAKAKSIDLDASTPGWFAVIASLQDLPKGPVELVVNRASKPLSITPEPDLAWSYPDRGLRFGPVVRKMPGLTFGPAMRAGFDETIDNISIVFATVRSLVERRVSPKNVGGPIMIAQFAYDAASSLTNLIVFLGMLSINLAVLNFLPIPPLDGGQMAFLIAEKIKGKPLSDSALIAGTYLGLIFVLCLMVFVTYQDVLRLVWGLF